MVYIGENRLGDGVPAYIIAEAGVNVRGDIQLSKAFVEQAANAGADAIKFQTHLAAEEMVQSEMRKLGFGDLYDRMGMFGFSREEHRELQNHCSNHGIEFLSTPFSVEGVELLDDIDVPAIKIGSGEFTNYHLLKRAADTGRPMLVSTGMSDWDTVHSTVAFLQDHADSFALLYCVSEYPTPPERFSLDILDRMRQEFDVPIGFSDHSTGVDVAKVAIARGADFVEKHFTIDRRLPGGDKDVSIEPEELADLTRFARLNHDTRGDSKQFSEEEASVKEWAGHSLVVSEPVAEGDELTEDNLTTKRPGTGIPARRYYEVLGYRAIVSLKPDTVLNESYIAK